MNSMIEEIAKAKRYAEEPERIQFTHFEAKFTGEDGVQTIIFDDGKWSCTCRYSQEEGDCSYIMAMQRVLGVTIPSAPRQRASDTKPVEKSQAEEQIPDSSVINIQNLSIRINEVPVTPQNLVTIVSALTELYTKCWLIVRGRTADLIEYTQTHNSRFTNEANLIILTIQNNSPLNIDWKLDVSPQGLMMALGTGIDAIAQASDRSKNLALDNQAKELSYKLKELETHSALADNEQARQIAIQKAELEKQSTLLEIEKQRLEVIVKRLEVEKMRIDYALEIAMRMVHLMRPNADEEITITLMQTLLPSLLQLGSGKGLELVFPVTLYKEDESIEKK